MRSKPLFIGTALMVFSLAAVRAQQGWQYTALGDSFATGYLAQSGYVPRYQGFLEADNAVNVVLYNLGQNGWHSGNLLSALQGNATFQSAVQQSNVVTWDIGTNDFRTARDTYKRAKCGGKDNQDCLRTAVSNFSTNWDGIVNEILSRRPIATTIVRTMDLFDPWVAIDQRSNTIADIKETGPAKGNDFAVLEYYLDQMNARIALTTANAMIPLAQVHAAFNGSTYTEDPVAKGWIASDGIHPNDAGHEVIAELFRALGYAPLR